MSYSVDKVTTGTCNFVSVVLNVAFVAETSTAGFTFEIFAALNSVAAIASLLELFNTTHFFRLSQNQLYFAIN